MKSLFSRSGIGIVLLSLTLVLAFAHRETALARSGARAQGPVAEESGPPSPGELQELVRLAQSGRAGEALVAARERLNAPGFDAFDPAIQAQIMSIVVLAALGANEPFVALETLDRLAPMTGDPFHWQTRLFLAMDLVEAERAASTLEEWAEADPDAVSTLPLVRVALLHGLASNAGEDTAFRVLETLDRVAYSPPDPFAPIDPLRIDHARLLLARGQYEAAAQHLEELTASSRIRIDSDPTFDPIREFATWGDLIDTALRDVDAASDFANRLPDQLAPRRSVVEALLFSGDPVGALAAAELAIGDAEEREFVDESLMLEMLHVHRASALFALERYDESFEALDAAMPGQPSTSARSFHTVNRAYFLIELGRGDEALAELDALRVPDVYGRKSIEAARACAAAQIGDSDTLAGALAFLRIDETANVGALQRGLLCANEIDEAAALYIRRLQDPELRRGALFALQIWRHNPTDLGFRREVSARLDAIRQRDDVLEAARAVGYLNSLPFSRPTFWDTL